MQKIELCTKINYYKDTGKKPLAWSAVETGYLHFVFVIHISFTVVAILIL